MKKPEPEKTLDRDVIQFRVGADGELRGNLGVRASQWLDESMHLVARRDLERYYELLVRLLARIELSDGEAFLIVDVLNATSSDVRSAGMLWAEIDDGIALEGLADKWGVDGPALVAKVRGWNLAECLAVVDAAERFWVGVERSDKLETRERLVAVGLLKG